VFHTFTLDSGAFRSFFRDRTTLTPLSRPVAVSLADPSGGPVLARYSTVLPCPAAPSASLSGLYLPSFSTNLVSGADLQDAGVDQFTPAGQRVTDCTCAQTGRHLATFTRRPGSSLYTLTTESPPVATSGQVAASSQVFAAASRSGPESAPCSCRLLSHQTLLWHHRLGHPSLPRLRGMASRVLSWSVDLDSCLLLAHLAVFCLDLGSDFHIGILLATHPEHMAAAKRVLRYLCSTSGLGLVLGGRSPVVLTGHADASWVDDLATQRSSSCEVEIYAGAMDAQELRWLTYLLTNLGGLPRSPPVLYVDNKAMLALCREHRLEHRTKHIALFYFLAREVQQRGQLRLAYVASQANTADIFTKALQPCDHQHFCTMLACFALLCLTGLTLHMDVSGLARVRGQGHERYFLLVVDDYSRYTSVFPLRHKGEVTEVLIDWIRAARLQLRESFGSDFPVLCLHSDRGGEFSSDLLRAFCRAEGIRQTFTLPASPQQNGIAERRIGMVMDVARTSMIHAAAPHFLWLFAVQYAAHQINLQPRVSMLETFPTLRWTGKVGNASAFRFYHPTSRHFLSSQDVTFDESVPYYRLFPYRAAPLPPPPLFLVPGPPPVDPLPPQGPAPSGMSQVDAVELVKVAVDSGAARGAEPERVEPGGAGSGGAEPGGARSKGAEPRGAGSGGAKPGLAESGGAEPEGVGLARVEAGSAGPGGPSGASSRRELLSPQELREWFARRWSRAAGAGGAGGTGGLAAAGAPGSSGGTGPGGARTGGTGAPGPGGTTGGGAGGAAGVGAAGCSGAGAAASSSGPAGSGASGGAGARGAAAAGAPVGAGVGASGAGGGAAGAGRAVGVGANAGGAGAVPPGSGGATRPRPSFVSLLEQVLGLPPSTGPAPSLECPPPIQSESRDAGSRRSVRPPDCSV
ncbi:unnamed protein product, partial [Closterium sp. NIES-53]